MAQTRTKILIVDDEPSSLELLEVYLRDKGYEIECAINGKECEEKIRTDNPDIVILDVRLPDMSGLEILERVKQDRHSPYVIIITAFHDMATTIKAVRLGAFEYIPKPIDVDELETAIKRAEELSRPRIASARVAQEPAREFQKGEIIGKTKEMNEIFKTIGVLSANRVNVLIEGETGTGKELVARAIHYHGSYKDQPFVAINCSAIVENLLESELFGHEKGAFTGAISTKKGMLETAEYGTVFLDEVAEMPLELQAKLLRVLQEREFQRVGGVKPLKLHARIVAATNRDLTVMVRDGTFREDLYYRLSVASIRIPPLRDRKGDIPLIIDYLLRRINTELHNRIRGIEEAARNRMMEYHWPGNIRELENVLTKAAILTKGDVILDKDIVSLLHSEDERSLREGEGKVATEPVPETDRYRIISALNEARWHYGRACQILGISRPTLTKKMKDYGIQPKSSKPRK